MNNDNGESDQERHKRIKKCIKNIRKFRKDKDGMIPIRLTLLLVFILSFVLMTWIIMFWEPSICQFCPETNIQNLSGLFKGYSTHDFHPDYVNVRIGNDTFVFDMWDEKYMLRLLGHTVTIKACAKSNEQFRTYFDLMEAWIYDPIEEEGQIDGNEN